MNLELERLQLLAQLCQVEAGSSFRLLTPPDKEMHSEISAVIRSPFPLVRKFTMKILNPAESIGKKYRCYVNR